MQLLHILNGHSTLNQFNQTELKGEKFVWREILSEGPATFELGKPSFWETRASFLKSYFPNGFEKHFDTFKNELLGLELSKYNEIILWFEYDLFCQVNLIAVLSWLHQQSLERTEISLICIGQREGYEQLVGLGEINSNEYSQLFEERTRLTSVDLNFAQEVWAVYTSSNHDQLLSVVQKGEATKFEYLKPALKAHLRRFPNTLNGLSDIEFFILKSLSKAPKTRTELVRELLQRESYYGFGDSQYFKQVDYLSPLFDLEEEKMHLNEKGSTVLSNQRHFEKIRMHFPTYGGASIKDFNWDETLESIRSN